MLLPEPRLDMLVDQLRAMRTPDRRAVLARLRPEERARVRALLRGDPAIPPSVAASFSPDIAARIAAMEAGGAMSLAPAAREALARQLDQAPAGRTAPRRAASLIDTIGSLVGPGRAGR